MDREGVAEAPADDPQDEGPVHQGGRRVVRIPIAPPTDETLVAALGGDRLIAAIAAVIRDAMAADAAGGVVPTTPLEDEGD